MSSDVVDEPSVYLTSGAPLAQDMKTILDLLLNHSFQTTYEQIVDMCSTKGYALVDVLQDLTIMMTALDFSVPMLAAILDGMSGVEYLLAFGTDLKLQTASLVGVFVKMRELTTVVM
jgi:replication factor C subunit 3/5